MLIKLRLFGVFKSNLQVLLISFKVRICKISDKSYKFFDVIWAIYSLVHLSGHMTVCRRSTQWTIKKRDILFLTITLANLNRFLQFLYHFNREESLHATILKFLPSHRFMCAPYLEKSKPTFLPWFLKHSSVHVTATLSNLNRFE